MGYDVYLGDFCGLVSREHRRFHDIKTTELELSSAGIEEYCGDDQPYKLCGSHAAHCRDSGCLTTGVPLPTQIYGTPEPPDLGECYDLINIPVDLVVGRKDKVIRPLMVRKHYKLMKEAGVDVPYKKLEFAPGLHILSQRGVVSLCHVAAVGRISKQKSPT
ncbi:hypothetical protein MLD38_023996 [Melastoma candidum]|uniref:Uncharacterized protein n=1 Tax=Melastoma candidum TaxID=119954 RepID=A0ACB9NSH9_9MYRT|nr:hypothetical protein MLD38_023996 [Melastoma candidum]